MGKLPDQKVRKKMLKKEDMDNDRDGKMKFCLGADTLETPLKPNGLCLPD